MAIKMNAKSKTLLTVLLVGSLCSLRASDMVEQEPKRLQITAATEQILDAIADVSTSGQTSAIQGTGFNTSTDSLVNISNNTTNVPLATNAQAVDILQGSTAAGTVIAGGTTFTADTNDLTSVSRGLSAVEGAGFTSALASLYANAAQVAANQVAITANSGALTATVVGATNAAAFNAAMVTVTTALAAAITTTTRAEILSLQTLVNSLTTTAAVSGTATSAYSVAQINATIPVLQASITNWLAYYPA